MKNLTGAVLAAACLLSFGMAHAVPKVSIKISAPKGTSGADSVTAKIYKGLPWLPCVSADTEFGAVAKNKVLTAVAKDQLQFDLSVTNEDVGKDGVMDYNLYVVFINHGAKSGLGTDAGGGKSFYFLTAPSGFFAPTLTIYDGDAALNSETSLPVFVAAANFASASFNSTLFGVPIEMDTPMLSQGMWSVLAILADPSVITGGVAIQDPRNWEAWTIEPFIIGSPFSTKTGVGTGVDLGAGVCK